MLQNRKNELTIRILSKLKAKGAPAPQVQPFDPLGSAVEPDEEDSQNEDNQESDSGMQATSPSKRKKKPVVGSAY